MSDGRSIAEALCDAARDARSISLVISEQNAKARDGPQPILPGDVSAQYRNACDGWYFGCQYAAPGIGYLGCHYAAPGICCHGHCSSSGEPQPHTLLMCAACLLSSRGRQLLCSGRARSKSCKHIIGCAAAAEQLRSMRSPVHRRLRCALRSTLCS